MVKRNDSTFFKIFEFPKIPITFVLFFFYNKTKAIILAWKPNLKLFIGWSFPWQKNHVDGVRNFQARSNLKQWKRHLAFVVYKRRRKAVVGIAENHKRFFPDPKDKEMAAVEIGYKKKLKPCNIGRCQSRKKWRTCTRSRARLLFKLYQRGIRILYGMRKHEDFRSNSKLQIADSDYIFCS